MTKATRIINEYHIKEMLLNGNPQFENFYKEELISFCEIAKEIIQNQQQENKKYKEVIDKLQDKFNFYKNTDWGLKSCEILKVFEDILKEVE